MSSKVRLPEVTVDLIQRYNQPGPRYTSYPTVPQWETGSFPEEYASFLEKEGQKERGLSLYVHLPFCRRLCTFCGCNKFITPHQEAADDYLDTLEKEMQLVTARLAQKKPVIQLHLGGGTPTFLTVKQLERLWALLNKYFDLSPAKEVALEVHPRVTTREQLDALYAMGFRRISLGVQDFDPAVQRAINRDQTIEQTESAYYAARDLGFTSINLDLVYGLPKQNLYTFRETLDRVSAMAPDRLAVYSFAYIPNMFKTHERAIKAEDLPSPDEKIALYLEAMKRLTAAGYVMIGMDHFARPEDELTMAQRERTLHRNFMGYTTLAGLSQIGLGVSAISDFGDSYFQNDKDLKGYTEKIHSGVFPSIRKKVLDADDILRRDIIETIMCQTELGTTETGKRHGIDFESYFNDELEALQELKKNGLLEFENGNFRLTALGIIFMRNVAMPFDRYLKPLPDSDRKQSLTI